MNQIPTQPHRDYDSTEYHAVGGKTILHFCDPFSGRIRGPYTTGEGTEPTVAEILDAALAAFDAFGKQTSKTVNVDFELPSGRHLRFQGVVRDSNVVFFETQPNKSRQ